MNLDLRWCFALAMAIAQSACDGDDPGVEQTALSSSGSLKTEERSLAAGSVTSKRPTHGRIYG